MRLYLDSGFCLNRILLCPDQAKWLASMRDR
jgi:hypothetical protein